MTGMICRLFSIKGFGFIRTNGAPGYPKHEYFFHASALAGPTTNEARRAQFSELRIGQPCSFELEPSEKGDRAGTVVLIGT